MKPRNDIYLAPKERETEDAPSCNCDIRTRLVGDGCKLCNPEYALDHCDDPSADEMDRCDERAAYRRNGRGEG